LVLFIFILRYEQYLSTQYGHRRMMRVLQSRAETYVDADDAMATFITVVPRGNWSKSFSQESDVGLLKVDRERRAILFEGDREHWIIPAESILKCEAEEYTYGNLPEDRFNLRVAVILTANIDGAPWEAPLVPQNLAFRPWNPEVRRELARKLLAEIRRIQASDA
jgi:hypothetical protein